MLVSRSTDMACVVIREEVLTTWELSESKKGGGGCEAKRHVKDKLHLCEPSSNKDKKVIVEDAQGILQTDTHPLQS